MSDSVLRSHVVQINGLDTPLLEAGPPQAEEAVVFVHGNPGSGRDWERLAADVATGLPGVARMLAPDMPGFGQAAKPADFDYTVPGYAAHLKALLETLGIRRVHLVLHDFGGPWGLAWAAAHPEAVASFTLINTGVLLDYHWHYLARIWRTPLLGELFQATATRGAFHRLLRHGNPRGLPRAFVDRMYDDFDKRTRRAVLRLYRATGDPARVSHGIAAQLAPLKRPALVVWGARDPYIPLAQAERQREVFDVSEVVVLDDSGHWPFVDHPQAVSDAVVPFLRARVGAS